MTPLYFLNCCGGGGGGSTPPAFNDCWRLATRSSLMARAAGVSTIQNNPMVVAPLESTVAQLH